MSDVRLLPLALLLACGGSTDDTDLGSTDTDGGTSVQGLQVNETTIGAPSWTVEGVVMFVAPMESATATCLLDENHRFDGAVWLPEVQHGPPYEDELIDAVDACGFEQKTTLSEAEFSDPNGIFLALVVVPKAGAAGSTPDFEAGDFIDYTLFPMVVDGDVRRDLTPVDTSQDRTYPDPLSLGYNVDGHSHVPLLFQMNLSRMPAGATPPGDYTFRLALRDASVQLETAGYDLEVPFTVEADGQ